MSVPSAKFTVTLPDTPEARAWVDAQVELHNQRAAEARRREFEELCALFSDDPRYWVRPSQNGVITDITEAE